MTLQESNNLTKWQELVVEQKQSGLSIKEFCKQKNISVGTWNYHALPIRRKDDLNAGFSSVKIINKVTSESQDIKLALPNGFQLALPINLDPLRLKQLVQALLSC